MSSTRSSDGELEMNIDPSNQPQISESQLSSSNAEKLAEDIKEANEMHKAIVDAILEFELPHPFHHSNLFGFIYAFTDVLFRLNDNLLQLNPEERANLINYCCTLGHLADFADTGPTRDNLDYLKNKFISTNATIREDRYQLYKNECTKILNEPKPSHHNFDPTSYYRKIILTIEAIEEFENLTQNQTSQLFDQYLNFIFTWKIKSEEKLALVEKSFIKFADLISPLIKRRLLKARAFCIEVLHDKETAQNAYNDEIDFIIHNTIDPDLTSKGDERFYISYFEQYISNGNLRHLLNGNHPYRYHGIIDYSQTPSDSKSEDNETEEEKRGIEANILLSQYLDDQLLYILAYNIFSENIFPSRQELENITTRLCVNQFHFKYSAMLEKSNDSLALIKHWKIILEATLSCAKKKMAASLYVIQNFRNIDNDKIEACINKHKFFEDVGLARGNEIVCIFENYKANQLINFLETQLTYLQGALQERKNLLPNLSFMAQNNKRKHAEDKLTNLLDNHKKANNNVR